MNDEYFMKLALKEAQKAYKQKEVPVGAILVIDEKVVGKGHNTRQHKFDVTNHAEINAIRKCSKKLHDWRLNDATLYVTLSPCPMCTAVIKESRIKRVVIGAINEDMKNQELNNKLDLNCSKIKVTTKILEKESLDLLQKFFKEQRKSKI